MNWQKILGLTILFFLFALLQKSFLAIFSIFGAVPNLTFIVFFLIIFSDKKQKNYQIVLWSFVAGFFLDIFLHSHVGPEIIALAVIGFLLKIARVLLRNDKDEGGVWRFATLFIIIWLIYKILIMIYLRFIDPLQTPIIFNLQFIVEIFYNFAVASATLKILSYEKKV